MSNELLNKILEKLNDMPTKQDIAAVNERLDRIEKKLDSTFDQVVRNSETQTEITQELNTHAHHFSIIDKQLVNHAIEIEKLKNR